VLYADGFYGMLYGLISTDLMVINPRFSTMKETTCIASGRTEKVTGSLTLLLELLWIRTTTYLWLIGAIVEFK